MNRYAVVTVKALSDRLHDLDQSVAGVYGIELREDAQPRQQLEEGQNPLEEAALDRFHDSVAIKVLDDFDIEVQVYDAVDDCPSQTEWL